MKIHFFGVWAALNQTMDNTYFLIESPETNLQVDCWWWIWLAQRVKKWDTYFEDIFISHKHTDHILWFFKLLRTIKTQTGKWYLEKLNVYSSKDLEKTIRWVIDIMNIWAWKRAIESKKLKFINIDDKKDIKSWEYELSPINLNSEKIEQYGFLLKYKGKKILFFGDEAVWVLKRDDLDKLSWVDYLICEAICPELMTLEAGWSIDHKKIYHSSAREAWKIANRLNPKNLVLVHTLENMWWDRQKILKEDAAKEFSGNIIVPNQGDILEIK